MPRTILHIDMDQFYAAVEIRDRPALKGKPVIIGSDPKGGRGRGVVSTASYEARKFGVHSAQPISRAWACCPQGVYLPVDMDKCAKASDQIHEVFFQLTPEVEAISLDEAFLDVGASRLLFGDGPACAAWAKAEILRRTALSCSVGVATNKFVAKVASELRKPDGLVVVDAGKEAEFLAPLPLTALWGVGPATAGALARLGLHRIGEIPAYPEDLLASVLGEGLAGHLRALALGLDDRPVAPDSAAKSIGREHTFWTDTRDEHELHATLAALAEDVAARLRWAGDWAATLTLKYRWEGFETHTRQQAMQPPSQHGPDLLRSAKEMLAACLANDGRRVRLLGLSAHSLGPQGQVQGQLFSMDPGKKRRADEALDKVVEAHGEDALHLASRRPRQRRTRTGFSPGRRA